MLIYAQRPDATACASLELWNEKMNCWVNKGAQGIALIDEEGVHRSGLATRYFCGFQDKDPGCGEAWIRYPCRHRLNTIQRRSP